MQWSNGQHPVNAMSMDVLRELKERDCSKFIFHAFSNGGCVVWEELQWLLRAEENKDESEELTRQNYMALKTWRCSV